jgi:hypothetical protein
MSQLKMAALGPSAVKMTGLQTCLGWDQVEWQQPVALSKVWMQS